MANVLIFKKASWGAVELYVSYANVCPGESSGKLFYPNEIHIEGRVLVTKDQYALCKGKIAISAVGDGVF